MSLAKKVEDLREQRVRTYEALLLVNEAIALECEPSKRRELLARGHELRKETGKLMIEHSKAIKEYRQSEEFINAAQDEDRYRA